MTLKTLPMRECRKKKFSKRSRKRIASSKPVQNTTMRAIFLSKLKRRSLLKNNNDFYLEIRKLFFIPNINF